MSVVVCENLVNENSVDIKKLLKEYNKNTTDKGGSLSISNIEDKDKDKIFFYFRKTSEGLGFLKYLNEKFVTTLNSNSTNKIKTYLTINSKLSSISNGSKSVSASGNNEQTATLNMTSKNNGVNNNKPDSFKNINNNKSSTIKSTVPTATVVKSKDREDSKKLTIENTKKIIVSSTLPKLTSTNNNKDTIKIANTLPNKSTSLVNSSDKKGVNLSGVVSSFMKKSLPQSLNNINNDFILKDIPVNDNKFKLQKLDDKTKLPSITKKASIVNAKRTLSRKSIKNASRSNSNSSKSKLYVKPSYQSPNQLFENQLKEMSIHVKKKTSLRSSEPYVDEALFKKLFVKKTKNKWMTKKGFIYRNGHDYILNLEE